MNPSGAVPADDFYAADTAILFTDRAAATFGTSNELLPLLGRSMLQRAVEALVRAGWRRVHVVLGDEPLPARLLLDDGARWGCNLVYHHGREQETMGALARRLHLAPDRSYLLADATRIPGDADSLLQDRAGGAPAGRAYVWHSDGAARWTGWGEFRGAWLLGVTELAQYTALERRVLDDAELEPRSADTAWSVATLAELLRTTRDMLAAHAATTGQTVTRGRGCRIHPSARLRGPVHLGQGVRIGANAVVGPNVAIGDGALIDKDAMIENAVVQPDTYLGHGLELRNAAAKGNLLANGRLDTVVEVTDPDLLSGVPSADDTTVPAWWEPVAAFALRAMLAPLRLALGRRVAEQPAFSACQPLAGRSRPIAVALHMADPQSLRRADGAPDLARHFRESFYPGLRDVAAGRLRLIGPTPRSPCEVTQLPDTWQAVYGRTRCGLLNESVLQGPEGALPELQFACDSVASTMQGDFSLARKVLWRYLRQLVREMRGGNADALRHNSRVEDPASHRRTA